MLRLTVELPDTYHVLLVSAFAEMLTKTASEAHIPSNLYHDVLDVFMENFVNFVSYDACDWMGRDDLDRMVALAEKHVAKLRNIEIKE